MADDWPCPMPACPGVLTAPRVACIETTSRSCTRCTASVTRHDDCPHGTALRLERAAHELERQLRAHAGEELLAERDALRAHVRRWVAALDAREAADHVLANTRHESDAWRAARDRLHAANAEEDACEAEARALANYDSAPTRAEGTRR